MLVSSVSLFVLARVEPAAIKVALQPYEAEMVTPCKRVAREVKAKFGFAVDVRPARSLPTEAFYKPRGRYRAEKLLADLDRVQGYDRVVGITGRDISTTSGNVYDWGIFGLGSIPGKSCVISTFRLGHRPLTISKNERFKRVVFHEIGHTLGLNHCPNPKCLMADAKGTIRSVDEATDFCPKCKAQSAPYLQNP